MEDKLAIDDWSLAATNQIVLILTIFFISVILLLKRSTRSSSQSSKQLPGPWTLPIIGNLHQMVGPSLPHRRLTDLAKKYGPLMRLELGQVSCVVVSSPEWAKKFTQTHDANFASRPQLPAASIVLYGGRDIGFAPYGEYWKKMRRICATELLGPKRVKSFRPIGEEEVSKLVRSIIIKSSDDHYRGTGRQAVNVTQMLISLGNSITVRAAFGRTSDQKKVKAFLPFMEQIIKKLGGFTLVDVFPSSKLLRFITGFDAKLNKLHEAADAIMEAIITDHLARRSSAEHDDEDLVDALLNLKENNDLGFTYTNLEIKAVILDIFLAGTDTWSVTVEWAMSELMKNPSMMEKAQKEVRRAFDGKGKVTDEASLAELHYLQLVVKETLRLHPAGPLAVPRESRETMVIDGYEIPAKTRIIINVGAICQDPRHWNEPETFDPERFLNTSIDYKGLDFHFIPFGAGRRMCPGMHYGIAHVNLVLANLLYHFDWKLPSDITPQNFDMSEKFGLEVRRKNNLFLIPIPYCLN
ncbi:unnamed protein product [Linum tenue]|uniref:Cytochrome P450 n=1 Tax=Linum tenue TaxID=586396 RepID=A0AAV0JGE5_9ROSI|nr:unnamed protein product [Linum tenue]